jgi:hypothetical protein
MILLRRAEIRKQDDAVAVSGSMSVATRMKFERLQAQADAFTLVARSEQFAFWLELASKLPSLVKLEATGRKFQAATQRAQSAFEAALLLNPQSAPVLRRYAIFLEEVSCRRCSEMIVTDNISWMRLAQVVHNTVKSVQLMATADEIDNAMIKEHSDIGASVTVFAKGSVLDVSREDVRLYERLLPFWKCDKPYR